MKIYIRAGWFEDNNESLDYFIYGQNPYALNTDNTSPDESYEDDFDDFYGYSDYDDFYNYIKRRKIYVPMKVVGDIPDYNAYRKALFGTLCLSMQSGESIETLYYELSDKFPSVIKDDAINPSDMLLEIVDATLYAQKSLSSI